MTEQIASNRAVTAGLVTTEGPGGMSDGKKGFIFALSAYLLWGVLPFYLKSVAHMPALEVVAHRIIWSVPIAALLLWWLGLFGDLKVALTTPRMLFMAMLTASLITLNWGTYVWAIGSGHAIDTALGYYINPLVNVVLGGIFLGERLSKPQAVAVGLAACAVLLLTVYSGGLPWISLVLAFSFGFYGFFRKTLPIGPTQGFMLEVLLLSVPSLAFIAWTVSQGTSHFFNGSAHDVGLLLFAGPATAVPLILYAFGAKLLRYTTIGLMQYIAPTIVFLSAIFVFGEPFSHIQFLAFALIWTALAIYTWSMLQQARKVKAA
ncbi:chloramphenicol-sensitive protein RarD [Phyllobacterium sp. YR620]|uniref:EamA family transporter RarD n=2 Tax=Phyllobacterium TaxID=28100 RepID=UPI000887FFB3|nr:chloramphenicol-sensitive protein RarD [Phyllobacterium sp. YR620]SFI49818.1 chloramphenicol-sensitive protein RarD [Phyllobacterium sp. CL33Tsu]